MRARHAVLLTPSESAVPRCLPSCKQIAPITPLGSALTSRSKRTENAADFKSCGIRTYEHHSCKLFRIRTYKNTWGGGRGASSGSSARHSSLATILKFFLFKFLRTLLHFFALIKNSTPLFPIVSALFAQNTGGGVSSFRDHTRPPSSANGEGPSGLALQGAERSPSRPYLYLFTFLHPCFLTSLQYNLSASS